MFRCIAFFCLTVISLASFTVRGQSLSDGWKEEINLYEQVYNAPLQTTAGRNATLQELANDKPLILAFLFTRCSGICSPFLLQLKENMLSVRSDTGFDIVVLSFDARDDVQDMDNLSRKFDLENDSQWIFAVTDSIPALLGSIGFDPVWDESRQQYDHDALLVGVNRNGYITKKLIGIRSASDLEALVASTADIFSPTYRLPASNTIFSCFNYDPVTGRNMPGTGLLFIVLPAVLTFVLLITVSSAVYRR